MKESMKIYLTEVTMNGQAFAGPNIVALDLETANLAAEENGLTLTGELDSIVVNAKGAYTYTELPLNSTLH